MAQTDRRRLTRAQPLTGSLPGEAPEARNAEQEDEQGQAQQVAEDARRAAAGAGFSTEESEHGERGNVAGMNPEDLQDVVDHMNQMERSGRIDMDAYRGERSDDDESGMLGEGGMEPGEIDENGREIEDDS